MHLPTVLPKQHLAVYGATFFALIIPLYYFSWHYHAAHPWQSAPHRAIRPPSMDFVGDWLNVHLVEPFNPSAISAYCNTTEWRPNLVFRFDNVNGSIADIRGNVVDFLFFALEAGASVLLPDVASQGQKASDAGWDGPAAFHHLFDEDWFLSAMSEACPQMAIYRSSDVETLPEPLSQNYTPKSRRIDIVAGNTRKAYRENIDSWLLRQPGYSPDKSTVINVEVFSSLWEIDTRSLPPSFRRNFPQVLRINAPLRRLAALALQTLATQHPNLSLDPRDPIPPSAFYGVHLEIPPNPPTDAKSHSANANFTSQTDAYISHALSLSLPLLYAASPNTSALAAFREKATTHTPPLTILTKLDLLPEQDLEPLSPSQQVLIDYAILQRCSVFSGFVNSSMVFDVALSRAQRREDEARVGDPWRTAHAVGGMVFDDGVSRVLGRDAWREGRVGRGVWP